MLGWARASSSRHIAAAGQTPHACLLWPPQTTTHATQPTCPCHPPLHPPGYAPLGLTAEPDAATLCLPPAPAGGRHLLIVASDGLWEVVGSGEAVAVAAAAGTPAAAAAALADLARRRGVACKGGRVLDDCTVAVAFVA